MSEAMTGLRREARRLAMTAIYSAEVTGYSIDEVFELMRGLRQDWSQLPEFTEQLARSVIDHAPQIAEQISAVLEHWKLERIAPVERTLLKLGCAEILYFDEIPPRVTINEYIELSKRFANENAPSFINGILDKLVQMRKKGHFIAGPKK